MGGSRGATLFFSNNKHCFITLPEEWSKEYSSANDRMRIFEVQWGEKRRAFFSWNGDYSVGSSPLTSTPVAQINGLLGDKVGLKHGQEIILQEVSFTVACQRVHVEPATIDDWEILELHTTQVEDRLLDQVRVIWSGMILPVWVDKKVCIFLKITSTEPAGPCVRLDPNTELFVLPQPRSGDIHRSPSLPAFIPHPRVNEMTDSSGSSKSTNSNASSGTSSGAPSGASGYISDFDSALSADSSGIDWTLKRTRSLPPDEHGNFPSSDPPWEVEESTFLGEIPIAYRIWRALSTALSFSGSLDERRLLGTKEDARRKLVQEFWSEVRIFARVEPLFTKKLEAKEERLHRRTHEEGVTSEESGYGSSTSKPQVQGLTEITPHGWGGGLTSRVLDGYHNPDSTQVTFTMLMQPTTVYLSSTGGAEILGRYAEELEQGRSGDYVNFLAFLTKLPSPQEKSLEHKEKLAAASTPPSQDGKNAGKNGLPGGPDTGASSSSSQTSVVRVVIHGDELRGHCRRDARRNLYSSKVFDVKSVDWFVQVPDLLRRQIGLELTARVELYPVTRHPMPVQYLILYPLMEKPMEDAAILQGFKHWLSCVSCTISPMPVQQHGTLIKFPVCTQKGFIYIEVLLSINQLERYEVDHPYFLLHPFILNKASIAIAPNVTAASKIPGVPKLPYWSIDDVDSTLHCPRLKDLGGIEDLGRSAIDHLSAAILARPLPQSLSASAPGLCHGGVLLCGSKGSGKTSLAKAVCRELSEWPYLAYIKTVDCKHLQGKRMETVQRMWEEAFQEAAWRQPSVVLLDDLDHIASSPRGPEHEIGPEVIYHGRIAQCLKDLMSSEAYAASRVSVLATCRSKSSLHSALTVSRGDHLFQVTLEIPPPSQDVRREVLVSVIHNRVEVDPGSLREIDLAEVTARMDGYVPRDICTVVERAIHAASCRLLHERPPPTREAVPVKPVRTKEDSIPEVLLSHDDFKVALHNYTPTALRDVPLHSAGDLGWEHVGGLKQVKQDLMETLLLPAKYPELFGSCPLRLRSGLLLYGPPGTGKTLLGSVVAKECGLNFISIKGPELLSKYIGASEQAVRDLFTRAQSAKPCILFFDEFDSLAPRRGHDNTGVTDRVVNQLLTQLDGVEGLDGVYVIGATSRPDLLDPALLRPGRVDKCLYCPIPSPEERLEIITSLTRDISVSDDVDLGSIVSDCDFFTGADIKALLYNAQLEAIHSLMPRNLGDDPEATELATPLQVIHPKDMEADDWKLTFLSAESDYNRDSRYRRISLDALGSGNTSPVHRRYRRMESTESLGRQQQMAMPSSVFPLMTGGSSESTDEHSGMENRGRHTPNNLQQPPAERSTRKKHIPHISEFVRDTLENEETPSLPDNFQDSGVFSTSGLSPDQAANPPIFMPSLRDGVVELRGENLERLSSEVESGVPSTSGSSPDQAFNSPIFMPSLRDRVVELRGQKYERLSSGVQIITSNYLRKRDEVFDLREELPPSEEGGDGSKRQRPSIRITQGHLLAAKRSMKPSVSAAEREKYSRIYQAFIHSRGGDFKTNDSTVQQRATLA